MKRIFTVILPLLICLVPMLAWAGTYYVSEGATGSWADAISRNTPCSPYIANINASAGDTVVYINDGGIFTTDIGIGLINPNNSGTEGNPITFKGEDGTTVVIQYSGYGAYLVGKSYIIIEDFTFRNGSGNSWISMRNSSIGTTSHHITIQNNIFEATKYTWGGIYGSGNVHHISILNNIIKGGVSTATAQGDVIYFVPTTGYSADHILIEGNDIEGGCHNALDIQTAGGTAEYIIIRNNKIHNPNHTSLNIYGSSGTRPQDFLVENNTIYDAGSICGTDSCPDNLCGSAEDRSRPREQHPNLQLSGRAGIIRNNVMYNGGRGIDIQNTLVNNRIYNNVFYKNVQGIYFNTSFNVYGNKFENNVFIDNTVQGTYVNTPLYVDLGGNNCTNEWSYNNFDETNDIYYKDCNYSYGRKTLSYLEKNIPSIFYKEKEYASGFADKNGYKFHLRKDSRLINAGSFLTYTNGAGNDSNTIVVDDARYFTDGWGLIDGDLIQISQVGQVRITNVDYSTNTITIDQNISWRDNQGVSLVYKGLAPDIGAYESESVSSPPKSMKIQ